MADTILPATNTPGAKAAKVGEFMKVMVNDCYEKKDQDTFMEGFDKLEDYSDKTFKNSFINLTPDKRRELLVSLDKEQNKYIDNMVITANGTKYGLSIRFVTLSIGHNNARICGFSWIK